MEGAAARPTNLTGDALLFFESVWVGHMEGDFRTLSRVLIAARYGRDKTWRDRASGRQSVGLCDSDDVIQHSVTLSILKKGGDVYEGQRLKRSAMDTDPKPRTLKVQAIHGAETFILRAHQAGGCPHCERSGAWTLAAKLGQGEGCQYMTRTFFVMQQGKAGAHNHVAKRDQGWCIGKSEISQWNIRCRT